MRTEIISLSIILSLLVSPQALAAPGEANGTVTYVVDGDTIYVQIQGYDTRIGNITVRLADIDSSEMNTAMGPCSRNYAHRELNGRSVTLDLDDKTGKDKYGRWVAVVFLQKQDGTLINFNKMLVDCRHACIWDFDNNEFDPITWWNGTHPAASNRTDCSNNETARCINTIINGKCSNGPLVGNSATGIYHYSCCQHAIEMNLSNVIWFISSEDARGQGYMPCELCSPPA